MSAPSRQVRRAEQRAAAEEHRPVQTITATEFLQRELPPARMIVADLLPEGAYILAGRPKMGKSWLGLGIGIAVAAGGCALGSLQVDGGEVLLLPMEDGPRRLQQRLRLLLRDEPAPPRLHVAFTWKRIDDGGLEDLDAWLIAHPDARLVVVDTLKRIRPRERAGATLYGQDYDAASPFSQLAQKHRVAIVLVTHTRKADADDPLDLISGSLGLSGAVDGALVLRRSRGSADAELAVVSRDLEDAEIALRFDAPAAQWIKVGGAVEARLSRERQDIIAVLRQAPDRMTPKEVAELVGRDYGNVKVLMWKMAAAGELDAAQGRYTTPDHPTLAGNPVTHPVTLQTPIPDSNAPPSVTGLPGLPRLPQMEGKAPTNGHHPELCVTCGEPALDRGLCQRHLADAIVTGRVTP